MNKNLFYLGIFLSVISTGAMSLISYLHTFNMFTPISELNQRVFIMPIVALVIGITIMISGIVIKED